MKKMIKATLFRKRPRLPKVFIFDTLIQQDVERAMFLMDFGSGDYFLTEIEISEKELK